MYSVFDEKKQKEVEKIWLPGMKELPEGQATLTCDMEMMYLTSLRARHKNAETNTTEFTKPRVATLNNIRSGIR